MWFILVAVISFIFKRRRMNRSTENNRNNVTTPNDRKLYFVLVYFIIFEIIQANIRTSIQYQIIKYLLFYVIFLSSSALKNLSLPIFNIAKKLQFKYWIINGIRDIVFFLKFIAFTAIFNLTKVVISLISIIIKVVMEVRSSLETKKITITEMLSKPQKLDFGNSNKTYSGRNANTDKYHNNITKLENIENLNQMQAQLKANLNTQNSAKYAQKEIENKLIDKEISAKLEELEQIRYELRMRKFKLLELANKLEEY